MESDNNSQLKVRLANALLNRDIDSFKKCISEATISVEKELIEMLGNLVFDELKKEK
jgi:hypothetical protein